MARVCFAMLRFQNISAAQMDDLRLTFIAIYTATLRFIVQNWNCTVWQIVTKNLSEPSEVWHTGNLQGSCHCTMQRVFRQEDFIQVFIRMAVVQLLAVWLHILILLFFLQLLSLRDFFYSGSLSFPRYKVPLYGILINQVSNTGRALFPTVITKELKFICTKAENSCPLILFF